MEQNRFKTITGPVDKTPSIYPWNRPVYALNCHNCGELFLFGETPPEKFSIDNCLRCGEGFFIVDAGMVEGSKVDTYIEWKILAN